MAIEFVDKVLSTMIGPNNPEPERTKAFIWQNIGLCLALTGLVGGFLLMWPVAQLYEPWGRAWRPLGFSAVWWQETKDYLFWGFFVHFTDWLPVIWSRFVASARTASGFTPELALPVLGMFALTVPWICLNPYEFRFKSQGSAKWADMNDLRREQLFCETGLILGRLPVKASEAPTGSARGKKQRHFIRNWETLSGIMISPPGTGKTVQLVTQILADWPDFITGWKKFRFLGLQLPYWYGRVRSKLPGPSMVINDPKGEIYDTTSKWRAGLGRVVRLAWAELEGDCYNPLDPRNFVGGSDIIPIRKTIIEAAKKDFGHVAPLALCGMLTAMQEREGWLDWLKEDPKRALAPFGEIALDPSIKPGPGAVGMLDSVAPLLLRLAKIYSERETFIDSICTILIPDSVELHWRVTGREAMAGMIGFSFARWERDPEGYGEPSFAKLLDWLNGMSRTGFSDMQSTPGGMDENGNPVAGNVDILGVGSKEEPTGGDADNDLTAKLLDQALDECVQFGYSSRVAKDLKALRMKPDRERGSVVSTAAGSITIFKNAAVRSRTSSSTLTASDLRGVRNPETGQLEPITVYIVVPLKDAASLGRVTALFLEAAAKYLLSEDASSFEKAKKAFEVRPVLMLLDEFWTLSAMDSLRQIPALGRGLWTMVLIVGQSFSQISSKYGSDGRNVLQELDNSTHYKILPAQNDAESSKKAAEIIGNRTVVSTNRSYDGMFNMGAKRSESLQGVPLIRSDSLMRLQKLDPRKGHFGWQLVRFGPTAVMCRPAAWFDMPELLARGGRMDPATVAAQANKGKRRAGAPIQGASGAAKSGRLQAAMKGAATMLAAGILLVGSMLLDAEAQAETLSSPAGCIEIVDLSAGFAYPGLRNAEGDQRNPRQALLGPCLADKTRPIPLEADKSCAPLMAPARGVAVEQLRTIYRDTGGRRIEVLPCLPSAPGRPPREFAMVYVSDGCPLEHLWSTGTSIAQTRRIFVMDGVEYEAEGCAVRPNPPRLSHVAVSCGNAQGPDGKTYPLARIDVVDSQSGRRREILPCQPDPRQAAALGLRSISQGCEGVYFDDLVNRQSFAGHRYMLPVLDNDGRESLLPVSGCVPNPAEIYAQSDEFVRYQHDDRRLISWLVMQRVMVGGPVARIVRQPSVSSHYIGYYPGAYAEQDNGKNERLFCSAWNGRDQIIRYVRGDQTTFDVINKPLVPLERQVCQ